MATRMRVVSALLALATAAALGGCTEHPEPVAPTTTTSSHSTSTTLPAPSHEPRTPTPTPAGSSAARSAQPDARPLGIIATATLRAGDGSVWGTVAVAASAAATTVAVVQEQAAGVPEAGLEFADAASGSTDCPADAHALDIGQLSGQLTASWSFATEPSGLFGADPAALRSAVITGVSGTGFGSGGCAVPVIAQGTLRWTLPNG